jgi:hypothetical protein
MLMSKEFDQEAQEAMKLPPESAKRIWRSLWRRARGVLPPEREYGFLSWYAICLEEEGRRSNVRRLRREAVRVWMQGAREHRTARSLVSLGCALERYGWRGFARRVFKQAIRCPPGVGDTVSWREQALAGLTRLAEQV